MGDIACYTCSPSTPRALAYIIADGSLGRLHFDLKQRTYLIYTTFMHVRTPTDLPPQTLADALREIERMVTEFSGEVSFQVLYNKGLWNSHQHCHWKIRIDEKKFRKLKREHLKASCLFQ
jgi:hypothetical protein